VQEVLHYFASTFSHGGQPFVGLLYQFGCFLFEGWRPSGPPPLIPLDSGLDDTHSVSQPQGCVSPALNPQSSLLPTPSTPLVQSGSGYIPHTPVHLSVDLSKPLSGDPVLNSSSGRPKRKNYNKHQRKKRALARAAAQALPTTPIPPNIPSGNTSAFSLISPLLASKTVSAPLVGRPAKASPPKLPTTTPASKTPSPAQKAQRGKVVAKPKAKATAKYVPKATPKNTPKTSPVPTPVLAPPVVAQAITGRMPQPKAAQVSVHVQPINNVAPAVVPLPPNLNPNPILPDLITATRSVIFDLLARHLPIFDFGNGSQTLVSEPFQKGPLRAHAHPYARTERFMLIYSLASYWFKECHNQHPYFWLAPSASTVSLLDKFSTILSQHFTNVPVFSTHNAVVSRFANVRYIVMDRLPEGVSWVDVCETDSIICLRWFCGAAGVLHHGEIQFLDFSEPFMQTSTELPLEALEPWMVRSAGLDGVMGITWFGTWSHIYKVVVQGQGVYTEIPELPRLLRELIELRSDNGRTLIAEKPAVNLGDYGLYRIATTTSVRNPPFPEISPQVIGMNLQDIPWLITKLTGEKNLDLFNCFKSRVFTLNPSEVELEPMTHSVGQLFIQSKIREVLTNHPFIKFFKMDVPVKEKIKAHSQVALANKEVNTVRETNRRGERATNHTGTMETQMGLFKSGKWRGCCGASTENFYG